MLCFPQIQENTVYFLVCFFTFQSKSKLMFSISLALRKALGLHVLPYLWVSSSCWENTIKTKICQSKKSCHKNVREGDNFNVEKALNQNVMSITGSPLKGLQRQRAVSLFSVIEW